MYTISSVVTMMKNKILVKILATDDDVLVAITKGKTRQTMRFGSGVGDGYLTGSDLEEVLDACAITTEYDYAECDCAERSWYGDDHDTACPVRIAREAL